MEGISTNTKSIRTKEDIKMEGISTNTKSIRTKEDIKMEGISTTTKSIRIKEDIKMEGIIRENRIHPPLPGSYQLRMRHALTEFDVILHQCIDGDDRQTKKIFIQTKENLDTLAWKADKQVQALKSKIGWLEEIIKGYAVSL